MTNSLPDEGKGSIPTMASSLYRHATVTTAIAVAIPRPIAKTYTYLLPENMQGGTLEGCRVVVPLGGSRVVGVIWETDIEVPEKLKKKLKDVIQRLDSKPLLSKNVLKLLKWTADYYMTPPGMVAAAAFPPGMHGNAVKVIQIRNESTIRQYAGQRKTIEYNLLKTLAPDNIPLDSILAQEAEKGLIKTWWQPKKLPPPRQISIIEPLVPPEELTSAGHSLKKRAPKQAALLLTLALTGAIPKTELLIAARSNRNSLERLRQLRLIRETIKKVPRDPMLNTPNLENKPAPNLNKHQTEAIEKVTAVTKATSEIKAETAAETNKDKNKKDKEDKKDNGREKEKGKEPKTFLLHGVTGSGKTEVYLKLIEKQAKQNKGAIVLVPEISLTPLAVSRFNNRFPKKVAVLHSGLSKGERLDAWSMVQRGERSIVIGPRSAVFAPVKNLGIIVVDEEHDDSYKQGSMPHYNGRDLAVVRGSIENIPVILGSASPSAESWQNAQHNRYTLLTLPDRATKRELPKITLIDSNKEKFTLLSQQLLAAIGKRTAAGEQSIILINRRGHSPIQMCFACGHVEKCPACDISMTYHRHGEVLRCHHCGHWKSAKTRCPQCSGEEYKRQGPGIQKVQDALKELLPQTRVIRMDADTTGIKSAHWKIIRQFTNGEGDVLLGTQMVAKGHDFPNVTLAAVIGAEMGLYMPDFRAQERTFNLLLQVAGRAGRGEKPGEVIIQTTDPDNPIIQLACKHDYKAFITQELDMRKTLSNPPTTRMIRLLWSGKDQGKVKKAADLTCKTPLPQNCTLLGPSEAAMAKIADKYRYSALLKAPGHATLKAAVATMRKTFNELKQTTVRMDVDVDPRNLM
ncbi:MAG: primosomal protein N' [Candidatus Sabulitectum sp.]|nr:primosomal protein N' [Candidatus Sabulitectum sp.]